MDACRSCHAPITWGHTDRGTRAPFDADGTNHFVTCPQRREWRKAPAPTLGALFADDEAPVVPPEGRRPWEA